MARSRMRTRLGSLELRSPLIAASGTVGSVWEWASVADVSAYGAAVAKSVSAEPWSGQPAPRLAPTGVGMLNSIGIQNSGIHAWAQKMKGHRAAIDVPIWGSAVGGSVGEFGEVAKGLEGAGVPAIEVNLSCPNLENGEMFSFDPALSAGVVREVISNVTVPVGAKLSPNTPDLVEVAKGCLDAGAEFLTLTNSALGFGLSIESRRPLLSAGAGGYSGPGLKPISLRCVFEVARALPGTPIVGCGGVASGRDVVEYLMAGASAVALGTIHLAEPKAGVRIMRELQRELTRLGVGSVKELIGSVEPW